MKYTGLKKRVDRLMASQHNFTGVELGNALQHYWETNKLPTNNPVMSEHILRIERAVKEMRRLTCGIPEE